MSAKAFDMTNSVKGGQNACCRETTTNLHELPGVCFAFVGQNNVFIAAHGAGSPHGSIQFSIRLVGREGQKNQTADGNHDNTVGRSQLKQTIDEAARELI